MRLGISLISVLAVMFGACNSTPEPESAETCDELGDLVVESAQDWIDALERHDATVEQLQSTLAQFLDSEGLTAEFEAIQSRDKAIGGRWIELRCAGENWDVLNQRADELTYTKPVGEYMVEEVWS